MTFSQFFYTAPAKPWMHSAGDVCAFSIINGT